MLCFAMLKMRDMMFVRLAVMSIFVSSSLPLLLTIARRSVVNPSPLPNNLKDIHCCGNDRLLYRNQLDPVLIV